MTFRKSANTYLSVFILMALVSTGCRARKQRVGNDRDRHGCIASAGYTWSGLLKECIRPFERGMMLQAADGGDRTQAACLVFNPDSSRVEVFLPRMEVRPVLSLYRLEDGTRVWKGRKCRFSVENRRKGWILADKGQVIYRRD